MKNLNIKLTVLLVGAVVISAFGQTDDTPKTESEYQLIKKVERAEPVDLSKVNALQKEKGSVKIMRKEMPKRKALVYPVKAVRPKK